MAEKSISSADYAAFRAFLENACGIVLGENKHYLVSSRLNRLLVEFKIGSIGYLLEMIKKNPSSELRVRVVDAMTTNETLWFRDSYPYTSLEEVIFRDFAERKKNQVRIWSAACSTGQEPYSISMITQEYLARKGRGLLRDVQIVATDISPTVLKQARLGCYDNLSLMRGLSDERRKRFFDQQGDQWQIKEEIKNRVKFTELNLMKDYRSLGKFDVIFCRNVLIYFSQDLKRDILNRMSRILEPGGYLYLGGSESIATYADGYEAIRHNGGLIYRLSLPPKN